MEGSRLYFAYGSNLSLAQMLTRCPGAQPVSPYTLHDHRLAFVGERTQRWGQGGVATVIPQRSARVDGALYRISIEDEAALDGFEGVSSGHYLKDTALISTGAEPVMVYLAGPGLGAENKPNAKYLAVIKQGYLDWKLPLEPLLGIETYPAATEA